MRVLIKVCLVFGAIALSESRTMSWGSIRQGNLLLFDQLFHERRQVGDVISKQFDYSSQHGSLITAIHVTDLTYQQDGGWVRIAQGGIGFTFVKLQLTSELDRQLLLNIELFGS